MNIARAIPFEEYKEFFVLPSACLLFKHLPTQDELDEVRTLLDNIEEVNKIYPIEETK